jgi:hypothetical protein
MRSAGSNTSRWQILSEEGKGTAGCFLVLVLLGIAAFIGMKIGPSYYSHWNFQASIKTEASRAGAHFLDDETIVNDVMDLARRNEIRLNRKDVKIERFAGQVYITVRYSVSEDFFGYLYTMEFEARASSYIGRL